RGDAAHHLGARARLAADRDTFAAGAVDAGSRGRGALLPAPVRVHLPRAGGGAGLHRRAPPRAAPRMAAQAALVGTGRRAVRALAPEEHPWRRGVVAVWLAWAAVLYLAFPVSIGWMWQLNERYALLFALLVPALLRPARGLRGAVPLLLVAATAFFAAGTALTNIRAFEREVGPFDEVLARAQPGRRLIGMIFEQNSRYAKFSAFLHFQAYYRARMGGLASFSFAELPQSPLRYRPENAPPPHPAGWEWHANAFRNDLDGYYYDYILVGVLVDPFGHPKPG